MVFVRCIIGCRLALASCASACAPELPIEANALSRSADLIQRLSGGNSTTRTTVPRLGGASWTGVLQGSLALRLSAGVESVFQISVTPKVGILCSVIT